MKLRINSVPEQYRQMAPAMVKTTAYKEVAQDCWWVYRYLLNNVPFGSVDYYKKREA